MGQSIPSQHPAVVLRSHYAQLRMLLAIAMIAVVSLTVAVVILAGQGGAGTSVTSAADGRSDSARSESGVPSHAADHGGAPIPVLRVAPVPTGQRYDEGPDEGTRGIVTADVPSTRYDGGPEEGSRGHRR